MKDFIIKHRQIILLVGACIIMIVIINLFRDEKEEVNYELTYTPQQMEYSKNSQNLIKNYNTFFTLEEIMIKIVECLKTDNYKDVYYLLDDQYVGIRKDMQLMLQKYNEMLKSYDEDEIHCLKWAYNYSNDMYICVLSVKEKTIDFLIRLNEEQSSYKIAYIESLED